MHHIRSLWLLKRVVGFRCSATKMRWCRSTSRHPKDDAAATAGVASGSQCEAMQGAAGSRIKPTLLSMPVNQHGVMNDSTSCTLQGMQETYSTYMDSIQEVLRQPPAGGSASGNGSADAPAAAAAAEAAVNGSQPPAAKSVRASAQTAAPLAMPPASGKAAPANLAGSPYAQQLWQRWFRDALTAALLAVSLWLMRRAIDGAADSLAAAGGGVTGDPPGFWQGRRMVFRHGSLLPLLQATPQAQ